MPLTRDVCSFKLDKITKFDFYVKSNYSQILANIIWLKIYFETIYMHSIDINISYSELRFHANLIELNLAVKSYIN